MSNTKLIGLSAEIVTGIRELLANIINVIAPVEQTEDFML